MGEGVDRGMASLARQSAIRTCLRLDNLPTRRRCPLGRFAALEEGPEEMETVLLKIPAVMERLAVGQTKRAYIQRRAEIRDGRPVAPGAERRPRAFHGRAR